MLLEIIVVACLYTSPLMQEEQVKGKWISVEDKKSSIEIKERFFFRFYKKDTTFQGTYKRSPTPCDSKYAAANNTAKDFILLSDGVCYDIVEVSADKISLRHTGNGKLYSYKKAE